MSNTLVIRPLTPEYREDFQTVMGPNGACYGCWCTAFLMRPKERQASTPDQRRDLFLSLVDRGPAPGLLMWVEGAPVGWMQLGPRAMVPEWNNPRRSSTPLPDAPADDPGVWAITCFFIRSPQRGRGLSHALVAAGIEHARASGARVLEASPMDRAKQSKSIGLFVGSTTVFEKAGFETVARQKPNRPLMRLVL
ncbi:MAG: GNAT family N-acetyltransferase [Rhodobacteraceae bacterium]|nr:GNAT family N-acetyltransferase [Paracoccaceae bacterium]